MELTARYGLEFNPFLKNAKEILYTGSEYGTRLYSALITWQRPKALAF